ncbi:MAG: M48 family metalloprotease [Cellvibrionales bacterium]|nr:M48 family metalloprotease [Cellvibrionales bacterium]
MSMRWPSGWAYRGVPRLLDAIKDSETALAMVMAHELAHIKLRHPATAMGAGFAVALLLSICGAGR